MPPPQPAPQAPPQAAAAPPDSTRRDDIHNQPQPPGQLGVAAPVAPGTPAELPAMPYAGDPKRHPTAQEANPNWEGQARRSFLVALHVLQGRPRRGPWVAAALARSMQPRNSAGGRAA